MSEEEQIRIKGKLVHELGQRKETIALLRRKLWVLADDLSAASDAVRAFIDHPDTAEDPETAIDKLPDAAMIRSACAELRAESKRYEVLRVQASHLGL